MVKIVSWKDFKEVTKTTDVGWYFKPCRPIAFILVNIAMFLGLSANTVSWISVVCIVIGCILISVFTNPFLIFLGFLFYFLRFLLDISDGTVARLTGVFSSKGLLIDYFGHSLELRFLFFSVTLLSFRLSQNIYVLLIGFAVVTILSCKHVIEGQIHSGFIYDVFIQNDKEKFKTRLNRLRSEVGSQVINKVGNYRESIIIQLVWGYPTIVLLFTLAYIFHLSFGYWWSLPLMLTGYCFAYLAFLPLYMVFMYRNFEKKWLYYIKRIQDIDINEKL